MDRVFVGDVVRRTAGYRHGTHEDGHICTVFELRGDTGRHFIDDTGALSASGIPYTYSAMNYELISRGSLPSKKKTGFAKFLNRIENDEVI